MPMKSQAQRKLMYAAAKTAGGVGGVSKAVAKEFVAADKPGLLPDKIKKRPTSGRKSLYNGSH